MVNSNTIIKVGEDINAAQTDAIAIQKVDIIKPEETNWDVIYQDTESTETAPIQDVII